MIDYINTNTFRDFADFVIMPNNNKNFTSEILKRNAIIYCKTDFIPYLFNNLSFAGRKYILITHASDYSIDEKTFKSKPPCIKKWYAENAKYVHPDLITIPIGLTPNKDIDKTILDLDWFLQNADRLKSKIKNEKILYCNWNTRNFPQKRANVLEKLQKNNIYYLWDYDFPENIDKLIQDKIKEVECGKATYVDLNKLIKYYNYNENLSNYKFVVAPPGNGDGDTHRVWEALYTGSFPIVLKSNIFNDYKNDLPIIQVNDYSEVTYNLLESYLNKEYNYEKLNMKYWKNRIKNDLMNL